MAEGNTEKHGDVGLPVSCYRIQPPYENFWQLECHWHDEMELFKVERGTVQIQCGNDYFEAREGDLVFSTAESFTPPGPLDGAEMDYSAIVFSPEMLCGDENDIARIRYVAPVVDGKGSRFARVASSSSLLQMFDQAVELLQNREVSYELRVRARLLEIFASLAETGKNRVEGGGEGVLQGGQSCHRLYQGKL